MSSPKIPMNMFPFTNADSWPNIGRIVTAGWSGTTEAKKSFVSSVGFGSFEGDTLAPYRGDTNEMVAPVVWLSARISPPCVEPAPRTFA